MAKTILYLIGLGAVGAVVINKVKPGKGILIAAIAIVAANLVPDTSTTTTT